MMFGRKSWKKKFKWLKKNNTWELVAIPKEREVVSLKWIYKIKLNQEGNIQNHKARFVARGFTQKLGSDFYGTFSPVARLETIRTIIVTAAQKNGRYFSLMLNLYLWMKNLMKRFMLSNLKDFLFKGENKSCID